MMQIPFYHVIPFYEPLAKQWNFEARLIRWLTFVWLFVGLIALFSASYAEGLKISGNGWYHFTRQVIWITVALFFSKIIYRTPIKKILLFSPFLYYFVLGLVLLTILGLGEEVNGAERWLRLGPVTIQPSEFMKPLIVLQGALIFGTWQRQSNRSRIIWLGTFAMTLVIILVQPNLSTTALCGMMFWFIALGAGLPFWQLGGVAMGGIAMAVFSISMNSYQLRRITSFRDPWSDMRGDGYQLSQSLLAIGSGGVKGAGFGMSQQKLFYLPIQYTDFIFSVFAEEFGFVGGVILIMMLMVYATVSLVISFKSVHPVNRLVALGVMVILIGQALLNIGVATGALPTTGVPFPMFSYGGSSVTSSIILTALLIRVAIEIEPDADDDLVYRPFNNE